MSKQASTRQGLPWIAVAVLAGITTWLFYENAALREELAASRRAPRVVPSTLSPPSIPAVSAALAASAPGGTAASAASTTALPADNNPATLGVGRPGTFEDAVRAVHEQQRAAGQSPFAPAAAASASP